MHELQRQQLADYLAAVLPTLELDGAARDGDDTPTGRPGEWDPDLACAIRIEVRQLLKSSPELTAALSNGRARTDPRQLGPALADALGRDDPHRADVLWALLGGEPLEPALANRGRRPSGGEGWLARGFAAGWMNLLVLATAAVGFFAAWGGLDGMADGRTRPSSCSACSRCGACPSCPAGSTSDSWASGRDRCGRSSWCTCTGSAGTSRSSSRARPGARSSTRSGVAPAVPCTTSGRTSTA